MGAGGNHVLRAALDDEFRCLAHRAGGRDHVVKHEDCSALDVADEILDYDLRA